MESDQCDSFQQTISDCAFENDPSQNDNEELKFHLYDPSTMVPKNAPKKNKNRNFYIPSSEELDKYRNLPASEVAEIFKMSKTKVVYLRRRYKEEEKLLHKKILSHPSAERIDTTQCALRGTLSKATASTDCTGEAFNDNSAKRFRPAPYDVQHRLTSIHSATALYIPIQRQLPSFDEVFQASQNIASHQEQSMYCNVEEPNPNMDLFRFPFQSETLTSQQAPIVTLPGISHLLSPSSLKLLKTVPNHWV